MSIAIGAHDPSVGVRRRHLPSFAGEERDCHPHHATDAAQRERAEAISGFL